MTRDVNFEPWCACQKRVMREPLIYKILKIYLIFRFYILKYDQISVFIKLKAIQDIYFIAQRNMAFLISVTVDPKR